MRCIDGGAQARQTIVVVETAATGHTDFVGETQLDTHAEVAAGVAVFIAVGASSTNVRAANGRSARTNARLTVRVHRARVLKTTAAADEDDRVAVSTDTVRTRHAFTTNGGRIADAVADAVEEVA